MKPFDLERAKAGDPVVTRDGLPVRIVDFNYKPSIQAYSILVIIQNDDGHEISCAYDHKGNYFPGSNTDSVHDLFMAPKKVQYWANVFRNTHGGLYAGSVYPSNHKNFEQFEKEKEDFCQYFKTILIHEEEI